jgi:1-acyl-sn-glycerol-3-phosphate acyltransferase
METPGPAGKEPRRPREVAWARHGPEPAGVIYRVGQALVRLLWRVRGGELTAHGLEHIPATGPFLLIGNHQSLLDPLLTQAVIRRPVFAMAKSTQFSAPVIGPLMSHVNAFPVRRYQIDAQAVRTVLRHLAQGDGVAIYIEGERSWDGQLQEPRRGAVRLVLRAGVPVIPTVITGSYEAWPRWSRRPAPAHVTVRFLPPLDIPCFRGRANRDAAAETEKRIMEVLREGLAG